MSIQGDKLKGIADAIREKEGSTGPIVADDYADRIRAIQTGVDTSDATAVASDITLGKTAYVNGEKITGELPQKTSLGGPIRNFVAGNPTVAGGVPRPDGAGDPSNIIIKDTVINDIILRTDADIVLSAPTSKFGTATKADVLIGKTFTSTVGLTQAGTIPTKAATTITPGTSAKTAIPAGTYASGAITVAGDANLKAENIKSGVNIFGITGSLTTVPSYTVSITNNRSNSNSYVYAFTRQSTHSSNGVVISPTETVKLNVIEGCLLLITISNYNTGFTSSFTQPYIFKLNASQYYMKFNWPELSWDTNSSKYCDIFIIQGNGNIIIK